MTYNFDPDKWYDDELYMLKSKLKNFEITESEYEQAVESLDTKEPSPFQSKYERTRGNIK
jgi:predicted negative regulator of RcsB-dependent stress response